MATKWSQARLLRKLRKLLQHPDLTIKLRALHPHNSAAVTWGSSEPTIIKVDPTQDGIITCVLHELLHIALLESLDRFTDTDLEETIIEALERRLYYSLTVRQHKWWRQAIHKKLQAPQ